MQSENKNVLEFLDLRLKLKGCTKITVGVYSKPTSSFTYVNPKTCYPSRIINQMPKDIALRLRCICYSDEKYGKRSHEYQNYIIASNCSSSSVAKQFKKCLKFLVIMHRNETVKNFKNSFC